MAGTIVADTLQNGTGTSTSMTNAITGSLKAWANFAGGNPPTIRSSYNVSSITYVTTGQYTVNFTNAFSNANYCALVLGGYDDASNTLMGAKTFSYTSSNVSLRFYSAGTTNYYDLPISNFMAIGN
jgi:hypothetical protein